MINCIICHRAPQDGQSTFCEKCLVFIPQIRLSIYHGNTSIQCNNCGSNMGTDRIERCEKCDTLFDSLHPPRALASDVESDHREKNRQILAKQIMKDKQLHDQLIGMMGLDRLPLVEQGVAMSAIATEKMHPLSGEFNINEAHTLIDMAYGIAKEVDEQWAIDLIRSRLAHYYIRVGKEMLGAQILGELLDSIEIEDEVSMLRQLYMRALYGLAHRLAGNQKVADEIIDEVYNKVGDYYEEIQPLIDKYSDKEHKKSQYLGPLEDLATYPRVDMIATILSVLVEESITRGNTAKMNVEDILLERLLELDNLVNILEGMTPSDDPGFFASYLREYVRLLVAVYWYPEFLIHNDDVKRQVLLEQSFLTLLKWLDLIPVEYWLQLRASKIIEIYTRANRWNSKIDGDQIADYFLDNSGKYHRASFLYAISEANLNLGNHEKAMEMIIKLLNSDEVSDTLITLAENLKYRIQLEDSGILTGTKISEARFDLPVKIQLENKTVNYEPESYMSDLLSKTRPVLKLNFASEESVIDNISLFGDRFIENTRNIEEIILAVGEYQYSHYFWDYGQQLIAWGVLDPNDLEINGNRMEVVIIQSELRKEIIYLLFEGQMQKMEKKFNRLSISPSQLIFLRGHIYHGDLNYNDIMGLLVSLMSGEESIWDVTRVYTLKTKD